jgi:hypothetical protein
MSANLSIYLKIEKPRSIIAIRDYSKTFIKALHYQTPLTDRIRRENFGWQKTIAKHCFRVLNLISCSA